jgi:hypothetical protein
MKGNIMKRLFLLFPVLVIIGCGTGSSSPGGSAAPPPAPTPSAAHQRLLKLSQKIDEFQKLMEDYKDCITKSDESECSTQLDALNLFSFGVTQ